VGEWWWLAFGSVCPEPACTPALALSACLSREMSERVFGNCNTVLLASHQEIIAGATLGGRMPPGRAGQGQPPLV
jgi:hypothetical protein